MADEEAVGIEQASEAITAIVSDPETRRFLFIAESEQGEWFSTPAVRDASGQSEAELLAEYIQTLASRTDQDTETVLREIVGKINERGNGHE